MIKISIELDIRLETAKINLDSWLAMLEIAVLQIELHGNIAPVSNIVLRLTKKGLKAPFLKKVKLLTA